MHKLKTMFEIQKLFFFQSSLETDQFMDAALEFIDKKHTVSLRTVITNDPLIL